MGKMKHILHSLRLLLARLGFLSAPETRQLDFLAMLETPGHPQQSDRLRSLSK
jgi:hypothetical protein